MTIRTPFLLVALAASTAAAAPKQHAIVDATVTSIGKAPGFLCGGAMATQDVALAITKVDSGPLRVKGTASVRVLACFGGPLLRPVAKDSPLYELDPDQIRTGSRIHVDLEDLATNAWFATTDKITVTKR